MGGQQAFSFRKLYVLRLFFQSYLLEAIWKQCWPTYVPLFWVTLCKVLNWGEQCNFWVAALSNTLTDEAHICPERCGREEQHQPQPVTLISWFRHRRKRVMMMQPVNVEVCHFSNSLFVHHQVWRLKLMQFISVNHQSSNDRKLPLNPLVALVVQTLTWPLHRFGFPAP